jgi:hypothetical protein
MPATPVTLQKKTCNAVGRSQAGGEGKASDSYDKDAEQGTAESLIADDEDDGGAGRDVASGGDAQGDKVRGEM